jgi:hypothetical protein
MYSGDTSSFISGPWLLSLLSIMLHLLLQFMLLDFFTFHRLLDSIKA